MKYNDKAAGWVRLNEHSPLAAIKVVDVKIVISIGLRAFDQGVHEKRSLRKG